MPGNVWHAVVSEGQRVNEGDLLLVIESMKMEFSVLAPASGTVHQLLCTQGAPRPRVRTWWCCSMRPPPMPPPR
ncbi:MAG: acetyl-CoA carboxylase biotin carboxyl carrier protein subunit [Burkholderiaceae bacterium]